MLVLSTLRKLLSQVLTPPGLHTAALLTPHGQLVAYASSASDRSKDEVRVLIGLSMEVWDQSDLDGVGMAECELGKILVLPLYQRPASALTNGHAHAHTEGYPYANHHSIHRQSSASSAHTSAYDADADGDNDSTSSHHDADEAPERPRSPRPQPLLLLAVEAKEDVDWDVLQARAKTIERHLADPLARFGERLTFDPPLPPVGRSERVTPK